ncbi:MAG: CHASE2 domain-containing protein, partial [Solirubrobacteraceae bacterium]
MPSPSRGRNIVKLSLHSLAILAVSGLLCWAAAARAPGEVRDANDAFQNQLFRWSGARPADRRVVLAAIDDASIARIGAVPWSRDVYARLIDRLTALGVKTIAFDVMFLDPSPKPAVDRLLAEATRRSGRVIHAVYMGQDKTVTEPLPGIAKAAAGLGNVSLPP